MSVVVAVETPEGVAMAWDTMIVAGSDKLIGVDKAWILKNGVGLGLVGNLAPAQALRSNWSPEPRWLSSEGPEPWLIRETARWREILEPWKSDDHLWPVAGLVAVVGGAYVIGDDLSVTHSGRRYTAIGSGKDWAEGALSCLLATPWSGTPQTVAEEAAEAAVKVAADHCSEVGGPIRSLWVPL